MSKKYCFFTKFISPILVLALGLMSTSCDKDEEDTSGTGKHIRPIHTVNYDGLGVDIDADDALLSLASENNGLTVYDTSNPARPLTIAHIDLPLVYKTILHEKSVFGFDSQRGLIAIDLLDHDDLNLTQALSTAELFGFVNEALWLDSQFVFASEAIGLSHYSLEKDFNLVGGKAPFTNPAAQGVTELSAMPGRLITASYHGDLSVYLRNKDKDPRLLNWIVTTHKISDLACSTEVCYAAALADGLFVYEPNENGYPDLVEALSPDKTVELVHVEDDLLFVSYLGAQGASGFFVYNISDASNPRLIHRISSESIVKNFATVGPMIYVLLEDGQLNIYTRESLH
jgi:hypothetical protein